MVFVAGALRISPVFFGHYHFCTCQPKSFQVPALETLPEDFLWPQSPLRLACMHAGKLPKTLHLLPLSSSQPKMGGYIPQVPRPSTGTILRHSPPLPRIPQWNRVLAGYSKNLLANNLLCFFSFLVSLSKNTPKKLDLSNKLFVSNACFRVCSWENQSQTV